MIQAKKRFGQNFLQDEYVINRIVELINPVWDDFMIEIGPGLGALTKPILYHLDHLHVIEIDFDIIAYLKKIYTNKEITIHQGDALKFDYKFNELYNTAPQIRVVGNLPYNISTPLLFYLAKFDNIIDMHFMLQKEVVERICAKPNCNNYGRLSVMLQYRFNCLNLLHVAPESFYPRPKVESAIVRLIPKKEHPIIDEKKLNHIVTNAFNKRRKAISNSLKNIISMESFERLGIEPNLRAENLTVEQFIQLSQII